MSELGLGLVCLSGLGGSGIVAADVAAGMAARGHRVHLLSDKAPFRLEEIDAPARVHTVDLPMTPALPAPPLTLALGSRLSELVRVEGLELLHVHYAVPNAVAAFLARQVLGEAAPPTVLTFHGTDVVPLGEHPSIQPVLRMAVRDAAVRTAPSTHLARRAERTFGLPPGSVQVIPNFVDGGRFGERETRPDRPFTVIHVSNFRPVKRAGDALEAFARVAAERPARLLMVGDGPDRGAVERRARALGVWEQVRFLGVRHDVSRWLRQSDVAVVPSASESFGLAALEALAAGLPVVATRVGGLPEVVREGETGLLAEVGDVDRIAAHLRTLADDAALRARMGAAGREDAIRRFTPEGALGAYESAYQVALDAASKNR